MLDQQEKSLSLHNETLIANFLTTVLKNQFIEQERDAFFFNTLIEPITCKGFPEFNPQTPNEFSGFVNYLLDVFRKPTFNINTITADDTNVLINLHIQGDHYEEFMGLPASGGLLRLNTNVLFTLHQKRISKVWMYDKKVTLTTAKGNIYQLQTTVTASQQSVNV